MNSRQEVIRTGSRNATNLIYPDHLKYDDTIKLPYVALLDRLKQFLCRSDTLLITTGFSFSEHLTLRPAFRIVYLPILRRQFLHFNMESSLRSKAAKAIASQRANFSVYAPDGAVINGIAGTWRLGELPAPNWELICATYWNRIDNANSRRPQ